MQIQIIEDDRALSDGIVIALQDNNTQFIQDIDIKSAKESFHNNVIDLIILDINLPDGNGYDYLQWVRSISELPVLILTANDMEMDEVRGLSLGADDYMTKPFSLAVLRARIQALARRNTNHLSAAYQEDGFLFDFDKMEFYRDGKELVLSVNEQRLLRILLQNKGQILSRNTLEEALWGIDSDFLDENTLSVTINRLRSKLEDKNTGFSYIQTIYGQGYRWKKNNS